MTPTDRFRRFAWGTIAYTIFVILWGGFVRASGSGAGCGDHWPLCNGELVPRDPALSTIIELGHRITSGLALPLVIILAVLAWRAFEKGSRVRKAAVWTVVLMIVEAGIGAGLVLLEHVAYNVSIARAYWMAAHLVNTFLLLGAMTLTAWWASGGGQPKFQLRAPNLSVIVLLVATIILGAGGAITALGDTLVIGGGIDPASDPIVEMLLGARVFHPTMAFVTLFILSAVVALHLKAPVKTVRLGFTLIGLFLVQMAIGGVNVWLQAPVWLQIVHLFVTDIIWIAMVVFANQALSWDSAEDERS